MPKDERVGLGVHRGVTPPEQATQNDHNQPRGIVGPVWLQLALLEQNELFSQENLMTGGWSPPLMKMGATVGWHSGQIARLRNP